MSQNDNHHKLDHQKSIDLAESFITGYSNFYATGQLQDSVDMPEKGMITGGVAACTYAGYHIGDKCGEFVTQFVKLGH